MAKPNRNKISKKLSRLLAPIRWNVRRQKKASVKFTEDYSEFKILSNDLELFNIMKRAIAPQIDDLNALFQENGRHNRLLNEDLDQYLVDEYSCQLHTEFDLFSIGFAINMTDVAFFELYSTTYNFVSENYKKPIATINKIKYVLLELTTEQQIFLLETLKSRLENGDDWNNEDHPQAIRILDHLYKEQVWALNSYDLTLPKEPNRPDSRKAFFLEYLKIKGLINIDNLTITGEFAKDSPIGDDRTDNQEATSKTNKSDEPKEEIFSFFTESGKLLLPYIKATFANGTPTTSGLAAFIIAADRRGLFAINVVEGGNQIKFVKALEGFFGNDSIKIGAYNSAMKVFNRTQDEDKKDKINRALLKINEIINT